MNPDRVADTRFHLRATAKSRCCFFFKYIPKHVCKKKREEGLKPFIVFLSLVIVCLYKC